MRFSFSKHLKKAHWCLHADRHCRDRLLLKICFLKNPSVISAFILCWISWANYTDYTSRQDVPDASAELNLRFPLFSTTIFPVSFFFPSFCWESRNPALFAFPFVYHPVRSTPEKLDLCSPTWLLHILTTMCFPHVEINPSVINSERRSNGSSQVLMSYSLVHSFQSILYRAKLLYVSQKGNAV